MKHTKANLLWSRNQSGYVLPWVMVVTLVAGVILVPFLSWMMTSMTGTHHRLDVMQEYYAADSGIEDAVYKIQTNYFGLPQTYNEEWQYSIGEVNGKQVDVTIEQRWLLEGLEEPKSGTMPHAELVVVGRVVDMTEEYTIYGIETYAYSPGAYKINRIGAWLPSGFEYLPGSTTLGTKVKEIGGLSSSDKNIDVESTTHFPNEGVIAIGYDDEFDDTGELIYFPGKTGTRFQNCERGYGGTQQAHPNGSFVSNEPTEMPYNGGTALMWNMHPAVRYEDLPPPPEEGGFTLGDEYPIKKAMYFKFTPGEHPMGIFSWVRTNRNDIYLSWDITSGSYRITSTATDPDSGSHTTIYSYVNRDKQSGILPLVGDAEVIGNSIIRDEKDAAYNPGTDGKRETLYDSTSATIPSGSIPESATVEAAYLYWSGWKINTDDLSYTSADVGDMDKVEQLAHAVDQATLEGPGIEYDMTADRVQFLPNGDGWSFSAFKDLTSLLQPESSEDITLYPISEAESVTITNNDPDSEAKIDITASSGNPDSMWLDGTIEINSDNPLQNEIIPGGSSVLLQAGSTEGPYEATVKLKGNGEVSVGSIPLERPGGDTEAPVILETAYTDYPQMTITQLSTTRPEVSVTAIDIPEDMNVYEYEYEPDDSPDNTIEAPDGTWDWPFATPDSYTIVGTTHETYEVNIEVTKGKVEITYNDGVSLILGAPGSEVTGEYTLSNVEAYLEPPSGSLAPDIPGPPPDGPGDADNYSEDLNKDWSYAGWSLIVIYSDPDLTPENGARHFFLYDNFLYAPADPDPPDEVTSRTFVDTGFEAPDDADGRLWSFVGDGDSGDTGDYIKFQAYDNTVGTEDGDWHPLFDDENPDLNVFNGWSKDVNNDIDIDSFPLNYIEEGDDSAAVEIAAGDDEFNLIYLLVAIRTQKLAQHGEYPTGITIYNFEGE